MKTRNQRAGAPLRLYDKIPHNIFHKLEAAGLTDVCCYRLLDMITFSDSNNFGDGCILSNAYFLRELGISDSRLKRLLRAMEETGFIRREVIRAHDFANTKRKIHPSDEVRAAWIEKYDKAGLEGIVEHCERLAQEEALFNSEDAENDAEGGGAENETSGGQKQPIGGSKSTHILNYNTNKESFSSKILLEEKGDGEDPPSPSPANTNGTLSRLEGFPGGETERRGHDPAVMRAAMLDQVPGANNRPDHKAKDLSWDAASEEARTILELWNALGCGTVHPVDGPGARKALYAIDNLILPGGYAVNRLADAVECYAVVTQGDGKRRSLADFLVVSDYVKSLSRRNGRPAPKPLFLEFYSANGAGPAKGEEEFKLYGELKRVYAAWTRGVKPSDAKFSLKERRNLLAAVPKLMRCRERGWLDAFFAEGQRANYGDYINVLFRGLKRKYGTDYGTGHVASDHTWNDLFPKFIQEDYGESVLRAQKGKGR